MANDFLTAGNTKIGRIHNWSIPAIKCCPGRSAYCQEVCYACNGFYHMANVQTSLERRFVASQQPDFVQKMVAEIKRKNVATLRVHVAGDFYSVGYTRRWIEIANKCPDTLFYAYTRSWDVAGFRAALLELAACSNFKLWLSVDWTMSQPAPMANTTIAYLSKNDDDIPAYPVDLVFREDTSTVAKRLGPHGAIVCPVEQGVERKIRITCEKCKLCFGSKNGASTIETVKAAGRRSRVEGETLLPQLC